MSWTTLEFASHFQKIPLPTDECDNNWSAMTKECRWYVIGKYCKMQKKKRKDGETIRDLLTQIGQNIGCSEPSIRRLVSYCESIDHLQTIEPEIVADILCGRLHLSAENVRNLTRRSRADIRKTAERVRSGKERLYKIFPERAVNSEKQASYRHQATIWNTSIKDTPEYDPDAQVTGLVYTIPSWVIAIERVFMSDHLCEVSMPAQKRLINELSTLKIATDLMIGLLADGYRGVIAYESSQA